MVDLWLGPCIRQGPRGSKALYLTFDDGPDSDFTPKVLEVLDQYQARATFFVIALKAEKTKALVRETIARGHSIGNHSWDHRYEAFFAGKETVKSWVEKAESKISDIAGGPTVGFRSPAGVRTPPLHQALDQLGLDLVHWTTRFYDTQFDWTPTRARRSLEVATPGDIVLLHDAHRDPEQQRIFLATLATYIQAAQNMGFSFRSLLKSSVGRR
jgi:peptidoglycan-N-acetylglucosamine deacetylase